MGNMFSDYYFWILLSQTWVAISKARERELAPYDLSEIRAALLFIMQLIGHDATPAKISRWLFREPHSISEILDRMEKQGLVRKVKDLDRKNQVRIEITEKGQECYKTSFIPESIPKIFSVLSEDERHNFIASLIKLREAAIKCTGIQYEIPTPPIETHTPLKNK
jgi:MarR family transcriptional regulator, multiple antibiotic resistance protein MarR